VGDEPGRPRRLEDDARLYAQLEQRADRTHGTSFDALIQRAEDARRDAELVMKRSRRLREPETGLEEGSRRRTRKASKSREIRKMARPGLEPGTPRFSVVCSTN
jgi:hypothetical protein